jgi:hypothetical protein
MTTIFIFSFICFSLSALSSRCLSRLLTLLQKLQQVRIHPIGVGGR